MNKRRFLGLMAALPMVPLAGRANASAKTKVAMGGLGRQEFIINPAMTARVKAIPGVEELVLRMSEDLKQFEVQMKRMRDTREGRLRDRGR